MTIGLSALRVELLTDPVSIGYAPHVSNGSFGILSLILNSVSANAGTVTSAVTVGRVFADDMQQCVVPTEYSVLAAAGRDLWNAVLTGAVRGIAISNTVLRSQITAVWSAGLSGTRNNLIALQTRACTRGETLFGESTVVDVNDVAKAVNGDF